MGKERHSNYKAGNNYRLPCDKSRAPWWWRRRAQLCEVVWLGSLPGLSQGRLLPRSSTWGTKDSVSRRLPDGEPQVPTAAGWGPPQFLAPWVSPRWQLDYSKCISQEGKRQPSAQMKLCFCHLVMKWHPLTGDSLLVQRKFSRRGDPTGHENQVVGTLGTVSEAAATAGPHGLRDATNPPPWPLCVTAILFIRNEKSKKQCSKLDYKKLERE